MIEFIEGKVVEISPTNVVIESGGVGYFIHISVQAFEHMRDKPSLRVLTHFSVKEDSQTLYGFYNSTEREIFRHLISVSGVGPAIARMILSSLNQNEIISAIMNGNVALLKSIKGIGPKAAQRLILELQDKMGKLSGDKQLLTPLPGDTTREAVDALVALGFARNSAEKAVLKVRAQEEGTNSTEELIKKSLKLL
jgi:holliday junction DNA helicase RuvA